MAIIRPSSDIVTGGWSQSAGGTLYGTIDETTADNSDYISSSSAGQIARIGLGSTTDPGVDTGHVLRYRAASDGDRGIIARVVETGSFPFIVPSKRVWMRQPPAGTLIDWSNPLAKTITYFLPLNGSPKELVTGASLTYGSGASNVVDQRGGSLRGSGSAAVASIPLNMSGSAFATVSFWLYWNSFANTDNLAMEYGTSFGSTNGWVVTPNSGFPATGFFATGNGGTSGTYNTGHFTRPSAAAWHHYYIVLDRRVGTSLSVSAWVDGVAQTLTQDTSTSLAGNFGNNSLYLFSRNNTSLFAAGKMQNLIIRLGYTGNGAEAKNEFNAPWQIFKPITQRTYVDLGRKAIAERTPTLTGTPTDYTIDLTSGEAALITDYSALAIEVEST